MEDAATPVECLLAPPGVFWLAGIVLLAVVVLWAVARYRANRRGIVPFESEDGRIEISRSTVRSLIERTVEQLEGIEEAHCRLKQRKELAVHLTVTARAPIRLQELGTDIGQRVSSALKTQIGLETIGAINIRVKKVLGEVGSDPAEDNREDPAEENRSDPGESRPERP